MCRERACNIRGQHGQVLDTGRGYGLGESG